MFNEMNTLHEKGEEETAKEAEAIALDLIAHGDLPLLYRAHAYMVLGCGNRDDFLWHAREAVRIVKQGIDWYGESITSAALLSSAQDILDHAEKDHEQLENMKTERELRAGSTYHLVRSRMAKRLRLSSMAEATVSPGYPRLVELVILTTSR
jgi:hypothetical protein